MFLQRQHDAVGDDGEKDCILERSAHGLQLRVVTTIHLYTLYSIIFYTRSNVHSVSICNVMKVNLSIFSFDRVY